MTDDLILLGHGSGGRLSHQLLADLILPALCRPEEAAGNDAAVLGALPGLLVACGRWVFWPRRPTLGSPEPTEHGLWARIGQRIARRPRLGPPPGGHPLRPPGRPGAARGT